MNIMKRIWSSFGGGSRSALLSHDERAGAKSTNPSGSLRSVVARGDAEDRDDLCLVGVGVGDVGAGAAAEPAGGFVVADEDARVPVAVAVLDPDLVPLLEAADSFFAHRASVFPGRMDRFGFPICPPGVEEAPSSWEPTRGAVNGRCPDRRANRDRPGAGAAEGGGGRRDPRSDRDRPADPTAARAALGAATEAPQLAPVDPHRRVAPVAVGLPPQARHQLPVVGGAEALGVPDHVVDADVELAPQPLRQSQRGAQLAPVVERVAVAVADVLDPDRGPVEADGVAAAGAQ